MESEQRKEIATFRFGIIADFVNGSKLRYGERSRLLREKSERSYLIPYSTKNVVTAPTIYSWIRQYNRGGLRLEALYPKERRDKGTYRALDPTVRLGILGIIKEEGNHTVPTLIKKLRQKKIIGADENLHAASIYRFIKKEHAMTPNHEAADRRTFEASFPNEIWQSDVMHGPHVRIPGVGLRKTYLCAIIDDHSRLIVHAAFYLSETLATFKSCLRQAVMQRGLPQKLYVDNGSCFSADGLAYSAAALGISLVHSRPYTPQGRGKIERWFRTVRESFLPFCAKDISFENLNEALFAWVDEYNATEHGTTRMAPLTRYRANLECVRPAPANLSDYFRLSERRKVRKDRTIQLNRLLFEAPVVLIDKTVECLFHEDTPEEVEIRWNEMSYGPARIVDRHVNARIGRDWGKAKTDLRSNTPTIGAEPEIHAGELFKGQANEETQVNETL